VDAPKPKKRRITPRRLAIAVAAVVILYTLGGFFGVPLIVRHVVLPRLSNAAWFNGTVTADKVRCNPFTLRLELENLAITGTDGQPVVQCANVVGDAQLATLWAEGYRFKELSLNRPRVNIVIEPPAEGSDAKRMNIDELLDLRTVAAWIEALPRLVVATIDVRDGEVAFSDLSLDEPVHQQLQSLTFQMSSFDTRAEHENAQQFTANIGERGRVSWTGRFFLNPLTATGDVRITDLDLSRYSPYYRGAIEVQVLAGELSAEVNYELAPLTDEPILRATIDRVALRDLAARGASAMTWLVAADEVATGRITADAIKAAIEVDSLLLDGGVATVLAERVTIVTPADAGDDAPAGDAPAPPAATAPAEATPAETAPAVVVTIEPGPTETLEPSAEPANAAGGLVVSDLLNQTWTLTLHQFDAREQFVVLTQTLPDDPVRRAAAREMSNDDATTRVIALDRLGVAELNLTTPPLAARVAKIEVEGPALAIDVDAQRTILLPKLNAPPEATPAPATPAAMPPITIDGITLTRASVRVRDASTERPAELLITDAGGSIGPIFTEGDGRTALDLRATVAGSAAATVAGQLNPWPGTRYADVALTLEPMTLDPLDGYFRRYLGHALDDGAARLELIYTIDGNALNGQNNILLQKFYLGDKSDSDEAIDLPIKLGVALLRDTKGNVKLNVPIEGDLSDPTLRVGGLVMQALVNTFARITTAPFSFLASSFGAGEQDISFIAFEPGGDTWAGSQAVKLDTLARALAERPSLTLKVYGGASAEDEHALRRAAFIAALQQEMALAMPENDPLRLEPARIVIDDATYRATVTSRHAGSTSAEAGQYYADKPGAPPRSAEPAQAIPVTFEQAEAAVLAHVALEPDAMASLAQRRAAAIIKRLSEGSGIDAARLQAVGSTSDTTPPQPGPIAWFELQ